MTARILSGREAADRILDALKPKVALLKPKLVIIQVGNDPASDAYVKQKLKAAASIGMQAEHKQFPEDCGKPELFTAVRSCNNDPTVSGIIVQVPLPEHLQASVPEIQKTIDPAKDVDGFHPNNLKKLLDGDTNGFFPATPAGVLLLLDDAGVELAGKHAVVIGRSNTVGKPLAQLLTSRGMTVEVVHRQTPNPHEVIRKADVLCSAAGQPKMVTADMVKPGAVVIDIGLTRVEGKLLGDVDFVAVKEVASAITPVPGGVGPMTVASLLKNCVMAAERQKKK
jgi:methylenetetrahydrofolate dehydrogenase (NADP+)/methenyltetrahydrofolate cyclohydrolase